MITQKIFLRTLAFMLVGVSLGDAEEKKGLMAHTEIEIGIQVSKETGSESRLRQHILNLTPIGTSPAETRKAIAREYPGSATRYAQHFFTLDPIPTNELMYVHGCIGLNTENPGWLGLFPTTYQVVWYFDQADDLFNVTVQEILRGP